MSQSKSFRFVQTIESTVRFCSYHEWYEEKLLLTKEYIQLSESLTISNNNNIKNNNSNNNNKNNNDNTDNNNKSKNKILWSNISCINSSYVALCFYGCFVWNKVLPCKVRSLNIRQVKLSICSYQVKIHVLYEYNFNIYYFVHPDYF